MTRFIAFVTIGLAGACIRRTDAEAQVAFETADRANQRRDDDGRPRRARPRRVSQQRTRTAWQQVSEQVEASIALLASDADEAALTDAAQRWCAVTPEPKVTDAGPTYVCFPREPLTANGRSFTLEFSPSGIVNLQIDELDEPNSTQIVAATREAVQGLCAAPFAPATLAEGSDTDFHTCPADGGTTLALGRARANDGSGWFVVLAVLGRPRYVAR